MIIASLRLSEAEIIEKEGKPMKGKATLEREIEQVAVDPVCGMNVPLHRRKSAASYKETTYYFCAEACRKAFVKNPERYFGAKSIRQKGWWGRYLERMTKINKEQLGGGRPGCCHH